MTTHNIILAAYLILKKEDMYLLYERSENAKYMPNMFSLVSGNVESKESSLNGIIREAKEEIGVILSLEDLKLVHTLHKLENSKESIDLFFLLINGQEKL